MEREYVKKEFVGEILDCESGMVYHLGHVGLAQAEVLALTLNQESPVQIM